MHLLTSCETIQGKNNSPQEVYHAFCNKIGNEYVNFEEHDIDWDSICCCYETSVGLMVNEKQLYTVFDSIITALQDYHISIKHQDTIISLLLPNHPNIPMGPTQVCPYYYTFDLVNLGNIRYSPLWTTYHEDCYAYIGISSFQKDVASDLDIAIKSLILNSPRGWIIDLRGNKGGEMPVTEHFLSYFLNRNQHLYSIYKRTNKTNRKQLTKIEDVYVRGQHFIKSDTPLGVIIDETTYSAANICAYIFATFPNATIIGEQASAGGGAGIEKSRLATHWSLEAPTSIKIYVNDQSTEQPLYPHIMPSHINIEKDGTNLCILEAIKYIDCCIKNDSSK